MCDERAVDSARRKGKRRYEGTKANQQDDLKRGIIGTAAVVVAVHNR